MMENVYGSRHGWRFLFLLAVLFGTMTLSAAPRRVLPGHVPHLRTYIPASGGLDATNQLNLILGLPLSHPEELTNTLRELYDPGSVRFHQFLTPEQFAAQFGPSPADYEALKEFARSNHLRIRGSHSNRTLLNVRGSVADIQRAFQVKLMKYHHPRENREFFAPDAEPTTDCATPLISITGLDNYSLPHPCSVHPVNPQKLTPNNGSGSGAGGSYLSADLRAAYVPGTPLTGAGQSLALFEVDGYYPADISRYLALAGLQGVPITNILVDGFSGDPGGNNLEVALDIEMAVAMAPGLSQVLVYEGPNQDNITGPNDILNRIATDNLARQISCSWNFAINANTEQIFQQFIAQGQSFFLASGDTGAFGDTVPTPSDDPYITVVGGTTLTTSGPLGAWQSERVWNWFADKTGSNASSGGVSTVYTIPSWQQGLATGYNQVSTVFRNTPDVSMIADGIEVYSNDGVLSTVGGTSASAPLWAGLNALINQQAQLNGQPPVGFLNPTLYQLGKSPAYLQAFHDITTGNNTNGTAGKRFYAQPGYDLCTGWGTPTGTNLINLLAPAANLPVLNGSLALIGESSLPTNGVIDPFETVTLNLMLTNMGGLSTSNLVATVLTNSGVLMVSDPLNFGAIPAGGSAAIPFTFSASGVGGGSISVTIHLTDGAQDLGTLTQNYLLGKSNLSTNLIQNFDTLPAPILPAGWTSMNLGVTNWVTKASGSDTAPNAAYVADSPKIGASYLVSPVFRVNSPMAQLTFRQNFDFEATTSSYFDGGALEISIGGGGFSDFVAAGGSFSTGGYNAKISPDAFGNVLSGRNAWGGRSGGYLTTTANLPSSAAGQNVQLRWVCGTDQGNSGTFAGWSVDTVLVRDYLVKSTVPTANLVVSQNINPPSLVVGQSAVFNLAISNAGPCLAAGVVVTDALPANITIVSAPANCVITNGQAIWSVGTLSYGTQKSAAIVFFANSTGQLTNTLGVGAFTPGTNGASGLSGMVSPGVPPSILTAPTNLMVNLGGTANFQVTASGTTPLSYQWLLNTNPVGAACTNTFQVGNVQSAQAGFYSVLISNNFGAITSSPVSLGIYNAPVSFAGNSTGLSYSNGAMSMTLTGLVGQGPVVIECSTDLVHWTPIYTNASGFGQITYCDTQTPMQPGVTSCFYRARVPGQP